VAADVTGGLPVAAVQDAAARAGLRAGDCIARIDGAAPVDVLDLEMAAADEVFTLTVLRDRHQLDLAVALRPGEWHGISLGHDGLGDEPHVCRNRCRFCFVDQVPPGLRAALYVKDDDYRLSFLHGNFTTLTNLAESDVERILALRLSPLYVSLHAWDDAARVRLMGRAAAGSRQTLERLAAAGLELHLQVVLCPDWNDGDVLAATVEGVASLAAVADLGIVPVSLAEEGDLRRVTVADAEAVLGAVAAWQERFRAGRGVAFVHAADEFHLLCGRTPPASDAPDQYENGIGMSAQLLEEAADLGAEVDEDTRADGDGGLDADGVADRAGAVAAVRLLTGTLAAPVVARAGAALGARLGVPVRPFPVTNRLFGAHVTVTGLLGGREVLEALSADPLAAGEWLVAPRVFLPEDLGRTLDDVGEEELAAACGGRLVLATSLRQAFGRLS
jgi:putative radical SAM enzyme (TIGR03279 family)